MVALPNNGVNTQLSTNGPGLIYNVWFQDSGTYYVYLRGLGPSNSDDSVHVGIDGTPVTLAGSGLTGFVYSGFTWQNYYNSTPTTIYIPSPGSYTFYLWMREDGVVIDRIWLTQDQGAISNGSTATGPAENFFGPATTPTSTSTPTKTTTPTKTVTPSRTPTSTLSPTSTPIPTLFARYALDETSGNTILDTAPGGPAINGTKVGAERVPGFGVNALKFAAGQRVDIPRNSEQEPANGFTLSAWVFPTQINAGSTYVILNKGDASQDYRLYINSNRFLVFRINDINPKEVLGPILPLNTWTHMAAVYDRPAGLAKLYVNGTLAASNIVTGNISWDTSKGLKFSDATYPFIGMLDEVHLFRGAIPDSQILDLANLMATATPNPTSTPTLIYTSTPTLTPTNTPAVSPTPLPSGDLPWGTGNDGDLTINSGVTYNIHTQNSNGRSCTDGGDAVAYNVTALGSTMATLSTSPASGCLNPGDEVLLINLQGTTSYYENTGAVEFLRVASVNASSVNFTTSKTKWYGGGWRSDNGIGTSAGQQRVMLMRVPNYDDVTVDGTLTGSAWNGYKLGVVVFRTNGTLSGSGTIRVNGLGYGIDSTGSAGESYIGFDAGYGGGSHGGHTGCCEVPDGGGGAYGTNGGVSDGPRPGAGGIAYGDSTLQKILFGSAGGDGGEWDTLNNGTLYGGPGGHGGGILWLNARTVNFSGIVNSAGAAGSDSGEGGAGGSIRLEAYDLTQANLSALGNSLGGDGRIAVYYQNSLSGLSSSPSAYTALIGQPPTPTFTPTPFSTATPDPYGTGADGDLTVNSGTTFNPNTQYSNGRSCADGISYSVIALTDSYARLSAPPSSSCLAIDDEVLLINLQGTTTNYGNVGNYDFLRIGAIVDDTIYFKSPKSNYYGANTGDDSNIGTGTDQQRVMLMRVPNYDDVTVDGTLTGSAWNGYKLGVVAFRTNGTLSGSGTVRVNGLGYGIDSTGPAGESYLGFAWQYGGGHHGGVTHCCGVSGGGGGAYGTDGGIGAEPNPAAGGLAYGDSTLQKIYFGSAGGDGGEQETLNNGTVHGGPGGHGGGILIVIARTVNFSGAFSSNGAAGPNSGGGGAGGSIRLEGYEISLANLTIAGSESGGSGRVAVYYEHTFSGNFTPGYLQKLDTPDTLFNDNFESGDLNAWSSSLGSVSASDSADYWDNYGLAVSIQDTNDIYVQDDTPSSEPEYNARFYLNPNGLTIASGDTLSVFRGYTAGIAFSISLQKMGATYQIHASLKDNSGTWHNTDWYDISDDWTAVEVDYRAMVNSGSLTLWLDGVPKETLLAQIDNDTRSLNQVRLGA